MYWNIGVLYYCGVTIGESAVSLRTITNFIQSLREYQDKTGIDLFDLEFKGLVKNHIEIFKVNTKIARTDSTQIATNVCAYNRLQLQIEAVKRVYRVFDEADRVFVFTVNPNYVKYEADNYVSMLKTEDIPDEFQKIGQSYLGMINHFGAKYADTTEWQMFMRIFQEQFIVEDSNTDDPTITIKPYCDKQSDDIRAIDDTEATLRYKSGVNHLGFVANLVETADPEADLNLICDTTLCQNNVSDGRMLLNSIDDLVTDRLTDLKEIHNDRGYGGPELDKKLEQYSINSVQTGIKGVKCEASMFVEKVDDAYFVTCVANQRVACKVLEKSYKAAFDPSICSSCQKIGVCPVKRLKRKDEYVYYMRSNDLSKRLRLSYINTIPRNRRSLRSGIEATVRQFKCKTKAGKSRLRGLYRHKLWFTILALAINVQRIYNYNRGVSKKRKRDHSLFFMFNILTLFEVIHTLWSNLLCISGVKSCKIVFHLPGMQL
ncbi:MAG: transposase [Candidatus Cloacimonetes bacterium]|nr:transposase [Candidatus Cloacimonadota bacterium]